MGHIVSEYVCLKSRNPDGDEATLTYSKDRGSMFGTMHTKAGKQSEVKTMMMTKAMMMTLTNKGINNITH